VSNQSELCLGEKLYDVWHARHRAALSPHSRLFVSLDVSEQVFFHRVDLGLDLDLWLILRDTFGGDGQTRGTASVFFKGRQKCGHPVDGITDVDAMSRMA